MAAARCASISRHLVEAEEQQILAVLVVVESRGEGSAPVVGHALPTWLISWVLEAAAVLLVPLLSAAQGVEELRTEIAVHQEAAEAGI